MNYYNTPKEIASEFCDAGIAKARMPILKFALLAFLGGTFIAFGGLLTVMVAGGMPSVAAANPGLIKLMAGALFPVGLIMVTLAGGDLFTSNCTGVVLPALQRRIGISTLLKVMAVSYVFNFLGTQFVAYCLSSQVGFLGHDPWQHYLHSMAEMKLSQSFSQIFWKGVGANWLVCLGAWMAFSAKDVIGKCIGIWVPVMIFVALGYEHSIANMFFVPAAIYSGADVLWYDFISRNLIPATVGNIVGGALLVATVYWFVYLKGDDQQGG